MQTLTYYALPQIDGTFILFRDGFEQSGLTLTFAKSYCQFAEAELVVLAADGTPVYTVH